MCCVQCKLHCGLNNMLFLSETLSHVCNKKRDLHAVYMYIYISLGMYYILHIFKYFRYSANNLIHPFVMNAAVK